MRSTSSSGDLGRLRQIPGLETASQAELAALYDLADECSFFAGHVIVRRGCVPRQVLLIASGSVQVTSDDDPEPELVGAGGVVGLRPVLQGVSHTEEAVVAEDIDVLGIRTDVLDLVLAMPTVGRVLGRDEISPASD
jgi:hypothetical protein